jgi:hypothetical protein
MRKVLKATLLSTMVFTASVQSTHASLSVITALISPAFSAKMAITGLAATGAGTMISIFSADECRINRCPDTMLLGFVAGLIFLNEDGSADFQQINTTQALSLGIRLEDAQIYNSELEEANSLLQEVSARMHKDITVKEIKEEWNKVKDLVSPQTYRVMEVLSSSLR